MYTEITFLCILQTVYFQINIATNGTTTYVSYVYQDGGMLWKTSPRRPRVGYTIQTAEGRKEKYELILNKNDSFRAYKFDEVIGNTNAKGRWSWKLSGMNYFIIAIVHTYAPMVCSKP